MSEAITNILRKYGETTVDEIRGNMARAGQNATGDTANSLRSEIINPNRVQVSGPSYVFTLETGRGPYKGGPSGNLKSKLLRWIKAKGVSFKGMTDEQASWAIYKTIQKKGTKLFREGGRDDIITPALDDARINAMISEIADLQTKVFADVFND